MVKGDTVMLQIVLNRSDGKPSPNLVAPRKLDPGQPAKGLVYIPFEGQIVVSLTNKHSKPRHVSYSMVFADKDDSK